jgi:hypothetical protein
VVNRYAYRVSPKSVSEGPGYHPLMVGGDTIIASWVNPVHRPVPESVAHESLIQALPWQAMKKDDHHAHARWRRYTV